VVGHVRRGNEIEREKQNSRRGIGETGFIEEAEEKKRRKAYS